MMLEEDFAALFIKPEWLPDTQCVAAILQWLQSADQLHHCGMTNAGSLNSCGVRSIVYSIFKIAVILTCPDVKLPARAGLNRIWARPR